MSNRQEILLNNMPFWNLVDYNIELECESSKQRIIKLMDDNRLLKFLKEKKLSEILDPTEEISCCYCDEAMINMLNRCDQQYLNV